MPERDQAEVAKEILDSAVDEPEETLEQRVEKLEQSYWPSEDCVIGKRGVVERLEVLEKRWDRLDRKSMEKHFTDMYRGLKAEVEKLRTRLGEMNKKLRYIYWESELEDDETDDTLWGPVRQEFGRYYRLGYRSGDTHGPQTRPTPTLEHLTEVARLSLQKFSYIKDFPPEAYRAIVRAITQELGIEVK